MYSDDWSEARGRFHHLAFAPDTREDMLKAADIMLENGVYIEYGPYKHAKGQAWGMKTVATLHTHGTPYVQHQEQIDAETLAGRHEPSATSWGPGPRPACGRRPT